MRAGLIAKGMIWSPTHGDTAFTVPLFDEFTKRTMPGASARPHQNEQLVTQSSETKNDLGPQLLSTAAGPFL